MGGESAKAGDQDIGGRVGYRGEFQTNGLEVVRHRKVNFILNLLITSAEANLSAASFPGFPLCPLTHLKCVGAHRRRR